MTARIHPFPPSPDRPPLDYHEPYRMAQAMREPVDVVEYYERRNALKLAMQYRPSFGERLVLFFRLNGETLTIWFALAAVALALGTVIGAYLGGVK